MKKIHTYRNNKTSATMREDKATLDAMLYGAEQWNTTAVRHDFRPRNRSKDLVKDEFVPYREVKHTNVPQHSGTFAKKAEEIEIKKRTQRKSCVNVSNTTAT